MRRDDFDDFGELILDESFIEYVKGTNPESTEIWEEWLSAHPERKEEFGKAVDVVKTLLKARKANVPVDKNRSLLKLMNLIDREQSGSASGRRSYNSIWFKIAAIGLLIIGFAALFNVFHNRSSKNADIVFNEIIVPLGEKAQIVLYDGTHVWINSASKLRYPVRFGDVSRDVSLEGEAFFDVAKNHGKTFVVNTRDVKINVLGTAFNVKCYPGDLKTQTIVVRGAVQVENMNGNHESTIIKPDEMATVMKKEEPGQSSSQISPIKIDKVDPSNLVSWKDQVLVFAGESLEDLVIKMERWFNVRIRIEEEELKSERYNGKFVHNETVYQVLEAIKITTPINYRIEKDTIIISGK